MRPIVASESCSIRRSDDSSELSRVIDPYDSSICCTDFVAELGTFSATDLYPFMRPIVAPESCSIRRSNDSSELYSDICSFSDSISGTIIIAELDTV